MITRRGFGAGLTSTAFAGLALSGCASTLAGAGARPVRAYGQLVPDAAGLLDLPKGFSYRIISQMGDRMDDGYPVPGCADGMGAIRIDERRMALVRNHELHHVYHRKISPFRNGVQGGTRAFDRLDGKEPAPGGTTTIIYDYKAGLVESQHLSLAGTIRNCAGGTTPWGSWLSCEEDVSRAGSGLEHDPGWVFEVPAAARGTVEPVPLKAMGRFNHEAAAVDPRTGIVYLTEDRPDSLFYRFLPARKGQLAQGGRLQALALLDADLPADTRNWSMPGLAARVWQKTRWIDLEEVESPADDLRVRGHAKGAALFARGEGIHYGDGDVYFCCTNGGAAKLGQVMRYRPSRSEGQPTERSSPGRLEIFVESTDPAMLNFGDNLTVAPNGHLIVCEDQGIKPPRNRLKGVTPSGALYDLALLHEETELAGACFSPDGATLFVNVYDSGRTLAITGPWASFAA